MSSTTTLPPGGVLTEGEIKKLGIITNGDASCYQLTSYDLRLGSCHYIFDKSSGPSGPGWTLVHIGTMQQLRKLNRNVIVDEQKYHPPKGSRNILTIPAYGSAIVELKEVVDTYSAAVQKNKLIVGRFDLKLSRVYQALISQQATQVEPLYKGRLYCFIHNLGDKQIELRENEKIATIEFSYAGTSLTEEERKDIIEKKKDEIVEKYKKSGYSGKGKLGIREVRWFYEQGRLPSDCGLNRLYGQVEQKVTSASERFDQQFSDYFEKESTLVKITDRVTDRMQAQRKNLEALVAVVTAILSLGIGSLIWMFYQELVGLMERQQFYEELLYNKLAEETPTFSSVAQSMFPWLLPYAALIAVDIIIIVIMYIYVRKKNNTELEEQLKSMKEKTEETSQKLNNICERFNKHLEEDSPCEAGKDSP